MSDGEEILGHLGDFEKLSEIFQHFPAALGTLEKEEVKNIYVNDSCFRVKELQN